jgi:hypothetical protein
VAIPDEEEIAYTARLIQQANLHYHQHGHHVMFEECTRDDCVAARHPDNAPSAVTSPRATGNHYVLWTTHSGTNGWHGPFPDELEAMSAPLPHSEPCTSIVVVERLTTTPPTT